jgi:hypothetical protein
MRDPLGPGRRKRKCGPSSHGKAHERDLVVTERIDDAGEIAGKMRARITAGVIGGIALTMAALIVSDDGVAIGQLSPLVKPHPLSASQSVYEDYRPAAARNSVGKLDIADANAVITHPHFRGSSSYSAQTTTSSGDKEWPAFLPSHNADNLERPRERRKTTAFYDLFPEDDHAW